MPKTLRNDLVVRRTDYERLLKLLARDDSAAADALDLELSRAEVVPDADFPADAVSMDSTVTFVDLDSGEVNTVWLVYPDAADILQMRISVLSPVGTALIGLRTGGAIDWPLPQGKVRRIKVVAVAQPPEPAAASEGSASVG